VVLHGLTCKDELSGDIAEGRRHVCVEAGQLGLTLS